MWIFFLRGCQQKQHKIIVIICGDGELRCKNERIAGDVDEKEKK